MIDHSAKWLAETDWLAAHRDLRTSRRIRLVHDLLAAEITAALRGS